MVEKSDLYAAVDLGSNSFHMIVAEIINNQLHVIDRHKDMVRLANGIDEEGLNQLVIQCLALKKIESLNKLQGLSSRREPGVYWWLGNH